MSLFIHHDPQYVEITHLYGRVGDFAFPDVLDHIEHVAPAAFQPLSRADDPQYVLTDRCADRDDIFRVIGKIVLDCFDQTHIFIRSVFFYIRICCYGF